MKIKSQRSRCGSRPSDHYLLLPLLPHVLLFLIIVVPLGQDPVIAATAVVLRGAALELPLHRGDLPEVVQLGGRGGVGRRGSLVAGKGGTG